MVSLYRLLLICFFLISGNSFLQAQCALADFILPDTVCIGENIIIENNTLGASAIEWDYCSGDLQTLPVTAQVSNEQRLTGPSGITLVQDGEIWIGFIVSRGNNSIFRLLFSNGLNNPPLIQNLGNIGNLLNLPAEIELIKEDINWYGLLTNNRGNSLIRLNFGSSLTNTPTADNLGHFGFMFQPWSIKVLKEDNNYFTHVISDINKNLTVLGFGNSISNTPQLIFNKVIGIDRIRGLDIIEECNEWVGIATSSPENRIVKLSFGQDLSNSPTITTIASVASPTNVSILREGDQYFAYASSWGNRGLYRLSFGESIKVGTLSIDNLTNFDPLGDVTASHFIKASPSSFIGFSVDFTNKRIHKINFNNDCGASKLFEYTKSISDIFYNKAGEFIISQTIVDSVGISSASKKIVVRDVSAPVVDISSENTICTNSLLQIFGNSDSNVTSWQWSFGDGTTTTGQEVTHQYTIPGTYTVTLEVESADGCGQRVTKDITIYEPPEPRFEVDQEVICTNGKIAFQNLTDTKGADEVISYAWDFNGEGSSTEANPSFTFTTGGSKTISLTASIPGCANTYDTTFTVEVGPVVNFNTPPQICQGQEITFENLTTGAEITGYTWTFGDGGTYTSTALESPSYVYDSAGTFIAMLEVNNASGCANTLSKTITIYAQPQAAFTVDIACAGAPTQFADESTTGINSNVIAWNWDFGDGGTSQVRNPQYTYAMPGIYEARLIVLTSAGCTDTLVQEIVVESAVEANFSSQTACTEDATRYTVQFSDQSSGANGEQISEWLWTINGENFVIADPTYTFESPGTYQVSLTVFSETACNASVTKNIIIEAPPVPDFSFVLNCVGKPIGFTNQSISENIAISQYLWDFGGLGVSYEENPGFVFETAGNYAVSLTLETDQGCRYSISKEIMVPEKPEAAFTADVTYGGTPLTVNFTNSSTAGISYLWDFGGAGESSEENPSFTFTAPGTYKVSLQVEDTSGAAALGCTSTFSKAIKVVTPVTDLQLQRVSLLSEEGDPDIRMLLTIRNQGTLAMSNFNIAITLDQVLSLQQTFEGSIGPGETINYPLDFTVSAQLNQTIDLRYICATLEEKAEDINLSNNRSCASLDNHFSVVSPYPNPSANLFKIDMVLPVQEVVQVRLLSIRGEILQNLRFDNTKAGLNTFTLDVSTVVPGNYILQVNYQDHKETHRLMVNP